MRRAARDTIYAGASGAAPSGVAVVRVSGSGARSALESLLATSPPVVLQRSAFRRREAL